ncbi:N-6 DNA methylase [Bradyrhizobium sp. 18BD]
MQRIFEEFDKVDWYRADVDQFGTAYEGLLQKSAEESKAGAGQYFTPRPLIDCIVDVVQPRPGERVQDPAAGSAGFLVAADRFIKQRTKDLVALSPKKRQFQRRDAFYGLELVPSTCRLGRMNMLLHGIGGDLKIGDALGNDGQGLALADVVLSNPPFGTKRSEVPVRSDLSVRTSSKQLNFLQHIVRSLSPDGGRAAVVLPDNALFENGAGAAVRRELMRDCRLHTILRLPTGIFYAPDVRTHVLFFCRDEANTKGQDSTKEVWFYDLRANSQRFTKRARLERSQFDEFVSAFGDDPYGLSQRRDTGERGRFRRFTRKEIAARGDSLNLAWLDDGDARFLRGSTSEQLVSDVMGTLSEALERVQAVQTSLRSLRR